MFKVLAFITSFFMCVPYGHAMQCSQKIQSGKASWYGDNFAGKLTASGEIFNPDFFSAAHPNLPFGTVLKVVNDNNNRDVLVRVNDRGAFKKLNRVIDLSESAAIEIGMKSKGVANVSIFYCNP